MSRTSSSLVAALALLQGLAAACSAGPADPEEEYRAAMQALYRGDLVRFYERLVPASYDRDLNALLGEARDLVSQEEFEQARQLLISFGDRVADRMQAQADPPRTPLADLLSHCLHDLPSQMGLGSYEQLQQATIGSILSSLQQAALGEALRDPSMPISWSRQEVKLVELSEGRARLRVTSDEASSGSEEKTVDLRLVEGKWIPLDLATRWEERIGQLRSFLDSLRSRKQSDPQFISRGLSELGRQIEYLSLFISGILESLARQASEN